MSSSGYADGLGRRALAFDREDGTMLERLVVRPELAAFEPAIRERIDRLATLDDERIARPRAIERETDGSLVVVSEFVPGSRLCDLLDTAAQQAAVPGVDVALGYLLDVLPALCGLHAGAGFAHGTIAPGRTILTPAGQVVLLDAAFGGALGRLHYSRRRLWIEFTIAMPPSAGPPRLDPQADIAQAAMAAVMLVTGRPIGEHEFPGGLVGVLNEVVDVAQIRGTDAFAEGLRAFLQRALPLPGRKPHSSADDALIEIRQLGQELGLDVCRRALVDFIEQMESAGEGYAVELPPEGGSHEYAELPTDGGSHEYAELPTEGGSHIGVEEDEDLGTEIDLDGEPEAATYDLSTSTGTPELEESDRGSSFASSAPEPTRYSRYVDPEPETESEPGFSSAEPDPILAPPDPEPEPAPVFFADPDPAPAPYIADPEPSYASTDPEPSTPPDLEPTPLAAQAPSSDGAEDDESDRDEEEEAAGTPVGRVSGWFRRKRTKSVRARKDKLRSAIAPPTPARPSPPPPPPPAPAPPVHASAPAPVPPPAPVAAKPLPEKSSWLIPPSLAASFEPSAPPDFPTHAPPVTAPPRVIAPPPPPPPVVPQVVLPVPPPPAPPPPVVVPPPAFTPPAASWTPSPVVVPPPAPPPPPPPSAGITAPAPIALKLKDTGPKRPGRPQPPPVDIYSSPAPAADRAREREEGSFPWKLAAAAVAVMVVGVVAGRAYLPDRSAEPATKPSVEAPAPRTAAGSRAAPAAATGRIEIDTQPAGARVLVDGKAAGESPLTLDAVAAGRHTLTFISSSGTVERKVRVDAGKTLKIDVPIFSGWVRIFAPVVLEVAENGQSIGTTEQNRLMLPPGRHELTLTNRALGYSSVQTVVIEPGEDRSLTIEPRGDVNFNAIPWAEVWIDGQKVGDTPIANLKVPLGVREITFKHPQFGERRTTITVKGNAPAAVVMDMSK